MIKLIDLVSMAGIQLYDYKIHCATGKNPTPLEEFFDGKFKQWQEIQTKENFKCKHVLSLIHLHNGHWLFAGVFKVNSAKQGSYNGKPHFFYTTHEVKGLEHLVGKAIIQFNKKFRASYLRGHKFEDQSAYFLLRSQ